MDASTAASERAAALEFLYQRINYERNTTPPRRSRGLGVQRMHELLARLGNPHHRLPAIHVAGTKGKGSTATMIAATLQAAGYRVGLYTSPHLESLEERFVVDGRSCTPAELVALIEQVRPVVRDMDGPISQGTGRAAGPTFFEITTALAMRHFVERSVDLAVLEVGMGGRLDSTNVCRPVVTAITSIGLDHTRQLGDTLAEIAAEKAGIIKPGVPVVSGATQPDVRRVIRDIAAERGGPLREVDRDFSVAYLPPPPVNGSGVQCGSVAYTDRTVGQGTEVRFALNMLGRHQAANAGVAVATLGELARLGWRVDEDAIRQGLATARCLARIEVLKERPHVVLDAGHNVGAIEALVAVLLESFAANRGTLIFGTTREKDAPGMLRLLLPTFDRVVVTRYQNNPRAVPPEEIVRIIDQIGEISRASAGAAPQVVMRPEPSTAWQFARSVATRNELICVTGSLFLAAELRPLILADTQVARAAGSSCD